MQLRSFFYVIFFISMPLHSVSGTVLSRVLQRITVVKSRAETVSEKIRIPTTIGAATVSNEVLALLSLPSLYTSTAVMSGCLIAAVWEGSLARTKVLRALHDFRAENKEDHKEMKAQLSKIPTREELDTQFKQQTAELLGKLSTATDAQEIKQLLAELKLLIMQQQK